jgi:zinc protease
MADLSAAGYDDVVDFFRKYYGPANASVSIAGDVRAAEVRALAEKWFGDVPPSQPIAPLVAQPVVLTREVRRVLEDKVQLPRLYLAWPTPPVFAPAEPALDALGAILARGKNSRLYKKLVYDLQIAQDVTAFQETGALASTFWLAVTARSGKDLATILKLVDDELDKLRAEAPSARELARFQNRNEAALLDGLETVGDLGGKADRLNRYFFYTGIPDFFGQDLARYRAVKPSDVRAAAARYLTPGRAVLSVVPEGHKQLAAGEPR